MWNVELITLMLTCRVSGNKHPVKLHRIHRYQARDIFIFMKSRDVRVKPLRTDSPCSSSQGVIFSALCRHLVAKGSIIHEVILSDCTESIHQCIHFSYIEALRPRLHRPGNINPHNWTRRAFTLHHTSLQIS